MDDRPPAAEQPSGWAARLTPPRVVGFAVLAAIPVKLLANRLIDPDLWWHLKTGQLIVRLHSIPAVDPFSYTAPGKHWVVQEWLSEVILYGIHRAFGLYGVLFYRAILVFILYALVARLLVRRMGSGMTTWALLALTAFAGSPNWTERPNLMSFVLFALTLELLDRGGNAIWWFVPIAALWANLHGMVILGIGLVLVVAAAEWLKVVARWDTADRARAKTLTLVSIAGIGAGMLNPYGPGLFVHAFRLIRIVQNLVSEWHSPNFHAPGEIIFLALLVVTIAALSLHPRSPDPTDVALALAFLVLATQAARNLALSAIVLGWVGARYLPGAIAAIPRRPEQRKEVGVTSSVMLGVMGVAIVLIGLGTVLAAGFPRSNNVKDIFDHGYPFATIRSLDRPGVRVFVQDGWSGLVIYYACGPVPTIKEGCQHARVFADLRWDFYGSKISNQYVKTHDAAPEWRADLDTSCTTDVLLTPEAALSQVLALDPGWRIVQKDKVSVLFERAHPLPGCPTA